MDKKQTCKAILSLYASLDNLNWQLANSLLSAQDIDDQQFLRILGYNKLGIYNFYNFANGIKGSLRVKNCDKSKLDLIIDLGVHRSFYFEGGHFSKNNQLGRLTDTEGLSFYDCSFANLDFLQNMPNLRRLSLSHCQIKNIDGLSKPSTLQNLMLIKQQLPNLALLNPLQNLETLHIHQNEGLIIQNSHFPNLKDLNLPQCGLRHLKNFPICPRLERLNLYNNQLQRLRGLERCPTLTNIDLSNNGIVSLNGLECLPNLKNADFSHNKIRVLAPQADIFAQSLSLDFNPLQKIANLSRLVNIQYLNVKDCQIKDFNELAHAPQLRRLITQNLSQQAQESLQQFNGRF